MSQVPYRLRYAARQRRVSCNKNVGIRREHLVLVSLVFLCFSLVTIGEEHLLKRALLPNWTRLYRPSKAAISGINP